MPDLRFIAKLDWREFRSDTPQRLDTVGGTSLRGRRDARWRPHQHASRETGGSGTLHAASRTRERLVFGGNSSVYEGLKRIKNVLPNAWLHSLRRGTIQEVEKRGVQRSELRELLPQHANEAETVRYLRTNTRGRRTLEAHLLSSLQ